jgi:glucan-binding YG repeat protein
LKEIDGVLYYYKNGELYHAGLIEVDGDYYYVDNTCKAVTNVTRYVNSVWANGLVEEGTYTFGSDGKMLNPPVKNEDPANGLKKIDGVLYYYKNGELYHAGLVEVDGDYYYIDNTCKAVTNVTRYVNSVWANGLVEEGTYTFGSDGKMLNPPVKNEDPANGLKKVDGVLYYYKNGELYHAGLVEVDGDYYYIDNTCKAVTSCTRYVNSVWANGLVPEGTYSFDENGRMIKE